MNNRSVTLDLSVSDDHYQPVLDAIRRYRMCCRQVYAAVLLGETAGAEITDGEASLRLTPRSERAKVTLGAALGSASITKQEQTGTRGEGAGFKVNVGKGLGYECRSWVLQELYPTALSFVWDSIRRDVTTVWTSGDPEFPKAKRGWLALQGARGVAQFHWRGIGFPVATARPKLSGHAITLKWDRELGPVEFSVGKLDAGRWYVWKQVCAAADGWAAGTLFLNERDGKIRCSISYTRPDVVSQVDQCRVCRVRMRADDILLVGPDGETTYDTISTVEARERLTELRVRRGRWERRRESLGSLRKPWGMHRSWRGVQEHLSALTLQRERFQADCNHAWSRRVLSRALAWRCGVVEVEEFPDGIGPHPWSWPQFAANLKYKTAVRGIVARAVQITPG